MRAIFLDKDGTLVENVPYNADPAQVRLLPGAGAALRLLQRLDYGLFVVTNQPGIARGLFHEQALHAVQQRLCDLLLKEGITLQGFYYCPHHPDGTVRQFALACACRKPMPGMIYRAAYQHRIDLPHSWMIGDILDDVEAGSRAGCRTVLIDNGNETEWKLDPERIPGLIAADLHGAARFIESAVRNGPGMPPTGRQKENPQKASPP